MHVKVYVYVDVHVFMCMYMCFCSFFNDNAYFFSSVH